MSKLKQPQIRSNKYLYDGKGQICTITGHGNMLIDCAHYSGFHANKLGKLGKLKAHDIFMADACRDSHRAMDGYEGGKNTRQGAIFLDAIIRTQKIREDAGLIWRSVEGVAVHEELDRDIHMSMWDVELSSRTNEACDEVFTTLMEFCEMQIQQVYDGELIVVGFNDKGNK